MIRLGKICVKIIYAGILAVAILCCFFSFYSVTPVHITNEKGNTDYVWPANSRWLKMTEGISWGRFDANGYNNSEVIEDPDIIILGSSHMEAMNVMQDENMAFYLNEALNGSYQVYNLGISGHHFIKVCKYLPNTLELFNETPEVIVIETEATYFTAKQINKLLDGTVEYIPSHGTGIVAMMQKLPFLRLSYQQLDAGLLDLFMPQSGSTDSGSGNGRAESTVDEEAYDKLFEYISSALEGYDTHIIIFYHPTGTLQADGSIAFSVDESVALFEKKCGEHGFTFVNMADSFTSMYYDLHKVPHGFITGELGSGHLNADGHYAIAQALADAIATLEEAGMLCR